MVTALNFIFSTLFKERWKFKCRTGFFSSVSFLERIKSNKNEKPEVEDLAAWTKDSHWPNYCYRISLKADLNKLWNGDMNFARKVMKSEVKKKKRVGIKKSGANKKKRGEWKKKRIFFVDSFNMAPNMRPSSLLLPSLLFSSAFVAIITLFPADFPAIAIICNRLRVTPKWYKHQNTLKTSVKQCSNNKTETVSLKKCSNCVFIEQ